MRAQPSGDRVLSQPQWCPVLGCVSSRMSSYLPKPWQSHLRPKVKIQSQSYQFIHSLFDTEDSWFLSRGRSWACRSITTQWRTREKADWEEQKPTLFFSFIVTVGAESFWLNRSELFHITLWVNDRIWRVSDPERQEHSLCGPLKHDWVWSSIN